jgi:tetratricopeptide (TPR) repeat protein
LITSLGSQAQNKQVDSLVSVLTEAKSETEKLTLLNAISNAYKTSSEKEVINYAEKALELSKRINAKTEEGNAYVNLGNGNLLLANYDNAIDCFKKAKSIFETEFKKQPTEDLKKV